MEVVGDKRNEREGEVRYNNYGTRLELVKYVTNKEVYVKICDKDKRIIKTEYKAFNIGNIKSVYDKSLLGVGYVGEIKYSINNIKDLNSYKFWSGMMKRCYSDNCKNKRPRYKNIKVCEEWHNFTNFKEWFDKNYYEIDGEIMDLDKDWVNKGNNIYSPENCIFAPHRINSLIISCNSKRGAYPIGVTTHNNKITAKCSILQENNKSRQIRLGYFNTPEEAFYAYKEFKEKYIKQVADEYKPYIPQKLYDAMYRYEVEITD